MNNEKIYKLLVEKISGENIQKDEPMKNHTSFKIGGPADFFITPKTIEELQHALKVCKENNIKHYVIGNGSNLLVKDRGFKGVIIQIYKNLNSIEVAEEYIISQAGALLSKIANLALANSLTGFEFASGIPGTLGGAVYMNAGAYGGEIKDVIESATVLKNNGEIITLSKEELRLGYRYSVLHEEKSLVLSSRLKLSKGDPKTIKNTMDELNTKRKNKQPIEMPSAGSTFKRPEGYFAGKLIMDAGLSGYKIGDAQVSEKHCGFVVNNGNATFEDVITLIDYIKKTVKDKFGVQLETEVKIIS